jgi:hypothetical protein
MPLEPIDGSELKAKTEMLRALAGDIREECEKLDAYLLEVAADQGPVPEDVDPPFAGNAADVQPTQAEPHDWPLQPKTEHGKVIPIRDLHRDEEGNLHQEPQPISPPGEDLRDKFTIELDQDELGWLVDQLWVLTLLRGSLGWELRARLSMIDPGFHAGQDPPA